MACCREPTKCFSLLGIKQTATFRKWDRKLRDQCAKALIAARIFRLANGLPGDVRFIGKVAVSCVYIMAPAIESISERLAWKIVILLCGGDKSSQKCDIEVAQRLAAAWRHHD